MVPEGTILQLHTHDTAGASVSQYLGAIEGGIDRIDLAMSPVSGGTGQPDILTMWHALKGTDYTLDIDPDKIIKVEEIFAESFADYFFPPESRMVSPLIPFSPMPGGALTANTMMMRDTGTLHLFPQVIKEMSEVVRLGGFGASVTPVSQFYFQQAYLNVTLGKWEKINPNYGNMVLGYFGQTPVEPDAEIVKLASEQLGKPIFKGDPLDILEPGIPKAAEVLKKNNLPETDENLFIASSCEDKGIDFLLGKGKKLKKKLPFPQNLQHLPFPDQEITRSQLTAEPIKFKSMPVVRWLRLLYRGALWFPLLRLRQFRKLPALKFLLLLPETSYGWK